VWPVSGRVAALWRRPDACGVGILLLSDRADPAAGGQHYATTSSRLKAKSGSLSAAGHTPKPTFRRHGLPIVLAEGKRSLSKLKERSLNVYENKGSSWKSWERSLNVYENKDI
jgi:hypothetical protein